MVKKHYEEVRGIGGNSTVFVDPRDLLQSLPLLPGSVFLDVGCGRGDHALAAASIVQPEGHVYAIDLWEDGIKTLRSNAQELEYKNLSAFIGNAAENIPVPDAEVDIVFMGVVLHDLVEAGMHHSVLSEISRVIKPTGTLAILEWKKNAEIPPGPPREIRLNPQDVINIVRSFDFIEQETSEWGQLHYSMTFTRSRS
ncbi:MAG TPA: methyltransferase domain-containing protein [Candidatus Lokiarchaeia archaeon]|nr:methyltransferase domain-containing protein [Candidatus Lokiarchaeia archaeon]